MADRPIPPLKAEFRGEALVAQLFSANGWKLKQQPRLGSHEPDLIVSKASRHYVVEVKGLSEGRSDRVIPALSHAVLQAGAYSRAHGKALPLAIAYVPEASRALINRVQRFAKEYAGGVAVGIVDSNGLRRFFDDGLADLNAEPQASGPELQSAARRPQLFSDLNQWMLKVLLAPEIPEHLLHAKRGHYRNVSELAEAAKVSVMSAFRFHEQLIDEGFLEKSRGHLRLVRRRELFRRWQADALRLIPRELSMVFLIRGSVDEQLRRLVQNREACLALFAAADALGLGHVKGVPPHVYVRKPSAFWNQHQDQIFPAGERPDLILRQAPSPESIFRGMVDKQEIGFSDVIQLWLDVSAHPSRGEEQASLIYRRILKPVVEGAGD